MFQCGFSSRNEWNWVYFYFLFLLFAVLYSLMAISLSGLFAPMRFRQHLFIHDRKPFYLLTDRFFMETILLNLIGWVLLRGYVLFIIRELFLLFLFFYFCELFIPKFKLLVAVLVILFIRMSILSMRKGQVRLEIYFIKEFCIQLCLICVLLFLSVETESCSPLVYAF